MNYHIIREKLVDLQKQIRALFYFGHLYKCPICNGAYRQMLPAGKQQRPNAICPFCLSYERHRLEWLYLRAKTNIFTNHLRILHFAPEPCFKERFAKMKNIEYFTADLYMRTNVNMDITSIAFPDSTFDCILCSHVLEHIENDNKAMAELYRVLRPGGWAILQVPITADKTYENPEIVTPEDRLKHFGLEDHVRRYGADYPVRLKDAGFNVKVDSYLFELDDKTINYYRLVPKGEPKEYIYYCSK